MLIIPTNQKKGIQANKVLNNLADKLDKTYKNSKNIKRGFDMGFDGHWEYVIHNTKTNKAVVLKQHPEFSNKQLAYVYARSFASPAQLTHDVLYDIKNGDLEKFIQVIMPHICK